jgi:PAS domain S-box-containing protein
MAEKVQMTGHEKVNILLVDDQPGKLLSYEVILKDLNENLIKASSGREALEQLLKTDIAVVLVDVCMPDLDGFQLAAMIREHPRFQSTAMIFISAIHLTDVDRLRGYEMGAVDYVPVPVIPEVLRAKVRVFAELYRKTRQLERLNAELEERVAQRTAELEASAGRLIQSEQRRSLALAASNMGSWDWDLVKSDWMWDEGQHRIFGVEPGSFTATPEHVRTLVHPEDWEAFSGAMDRMFREGGAYETVFRVRRPDGEIRWCLGTAAASVDAEGRVIRISGVTADITERKLAEERQALLAREVDHRAKNALALVQAIVRMTKAGNIEAYIAAVEGRIKALSRVHTVLSQSRWEGADLAGLVAEELLPYRTNDPDRVQASGPGIVLQPPAAQTLALVLHELVTNAAKYGALSSLSGKVKLDWTSDGQTIAFTWTETGGPATSKPATLGFGTRIVLASIERQLGGRVEFDWKPQGLTCTFAIPHGDKKEASERFGAPARPSDKDGAAPDPRISISGNRVMIVEDEALVAMVVTESLTTLGCSVVGPFSRCSDAIAAIESDEIDAAILDVNLDGEMVYPLADMLAHRGVPFIFVTGYGAESIDRRFKHIPVIQKPVERHVLQRIFVPIADDTPKVDTPKPVPLHGNGSARASVA